MQVAFFFGRHKRGPAPHTKCNAMLRSKFDIGRADARARGMSISGGASGMGASSSSSDASAMAQSHRVFWSGIWLNVPGQEISPTASLKWASLWARKRRQPVVHALFSSQKSVTARAAHSADDWRRHALSPCPVHHDVVEGAIEDGAGKSGARLRLDAALEAAEDSHVAGLQVRRASWREEAQYDV